MSIQYATTIPLTTPRYKPYPFDDLPLKTAYYIEKPDRVHQIRGNMYVRMPKHKTTKAPHIPAVTTEHLSVAYGDNTVLDDISLTIEQGEVAAIIGPNGSGKTTLMRAILGLIPHKFGEVRIFGKHLHAMRSTIGYVPQHFDFDVDFPITVGEFMDLARHTHCPKSRIDEKIKEVGLPSMILSKHLGSLSGGQLQRVLIAQAILNNPTLLFLDEPATGIDIIGEATFYDIIKHLNEEHDTTAVLVSHDIAVVASLVDQVICVNKKLLCSGPPSTALSEKTLSEVFGHYASIYEHGTHDEEDDRHHH